MAADPACAKKHSTPADERGTGPRQRQHHGQRHGLRYRGTSGREDVHGSHDSRNARSERLSIQAPHAKGIMVGQPYKILNSDGILHNVHSLPKVNPAIQQADAAPRSRRRPRRSTKPEPIFQIKCDVHPWMTAYIGVFTHPFYSVTATDGKFTISGLDAGTYGISAWHEKLGTRRLRSRLPPRDPRLRTSSSPVPRSSNPETSRMSDSAAVAPPQAARRARSPSRGARLLAHVRFSVDHKVIGIQYAVTGLLFLSVRLFPDDAPCAGVSPIRAPRCHCSAGSSARRACRAGRCSRTSTTSSGRCTAPSWSSSGSCPSLSEDSGTSWSRSK